MKINQDTYAVGDVRLVLLLECDCVCVWVTERETESQGERALEVIGLSLRCLIFYVWEKARVDMTEDAIRHLSGPER